MKIFLTILLVNVFGSLALPTSNNQPQEPTKPDADYSKWGAFNEHRTELCRTNYSNVLTTSGIVGQYYRWENFYVYIDDSFSEYEYKIINAGLYDLSQVLCIGVKIWPQNSQPTGDYAFIQRGGSGTGCYSAVGRQGGQQIINLQYNGCINKGTLIHESIHAMYCLMNNCCYDLVNSNIVSNSVHFTFASFQHY